MHLRKQSRAVFGLILALQLATSFGAIALLTRMGPAIAVVSEENVESLAAVEGMAAALALAPSDAARAAFLTQYQRADRNITEAGEVPLLKSIQADADAALNGDPLIRVRIIANLHQLAEVNRSALRQADAEAQRLARAGAWAAVILALAAFVLVRLVNIRVDRRFVMPILEIASALESVRQGNRYRRCSASSDSPEIQSIAENVNLLLDDTVPRGEQTAADSNSK
jgi:microcystin degradation protein MlrC